jgi:hypothetical protein
VEDATRAELEALNVADIAPGLAETALKLARWLDAAEAPTSAAVVARDLRATLLELRKVAPRAKEGDALDEIAARRAERRARAAGG